MLKLFSFLAVFVLAFWPTCFAQAEYTCANLFQFPELAPLKPSLAHYDSIQEANLQVRYQKLVDFIDRQNTLPSTGNPFIDVTRFSAGYDLIEEMVPAIKRSIEVNYPLEMSENLLSGRRSDVTVEVIEDSIVANLVDVSLHSNLWNVYVKLRVQQTLPGDPHPHTSIVEESFAIREDGLSVYWPQTHLREDRNSNPTDYKVVVRQDDRLHVVSFIDWAIANFPDKNSDGTPYTFKAGIILLRGARNQLGNPVLNDWKEGRIEELGQPSPTDGFIPKNRGMFYLGSEFSPIAHPSSHLVIPLQLTKQDLIEIYFTQARWKQAVVQSHLGRRGISVSTVEWQESDMDDNPINDKMLTPFAHPVLGIPLRFTLFGRALSEFISQHVSHVLDDPAYAPYFKQ